MAVNVKSDTNPALELLLSELNNLFTGMKINVVSHSSNKPAYPPCFIVGSPGSGSTLLLQWLAASNAFTYPSKLLSRFYRTPYIGAKIQKMLLDPESSIKNENMIPEDINKSFIESCFTPESGLFTPCDFLRFWERFFDYQQMQNMSGRQFDEIDMSVFGSELAALESVNNKPIAMKGHYMNWNLSLLADFLPNAFFIYLNREKYFSVQSAFLARHLSEGNYDVDLLETPEYVKLKKMNYYKQAAGQVFFTNRSVESGLQNIAENRKITVSYEEFCRNPQNLWLKITDRLGELGYNADRNYNGPDSLNPDNTIKVSKMEKDRIVAAYYSLFGENIGPK